MEEDPNRDFRDVDLLGPGSVWTSGRGVWVGRAHGERVNRQTVLQNWTKIVPYRSLSLLGTRRGGSSSPSLSWLPTGLRTVGSSLFPLLGSKYVSGTLLNRPETAPELAPTVLVPRGEKNSFVRWRWSFVVSCRVSVSGSHDIWSRWTRRESKSGPSRRSVVLWGETSRKKRRAVIRVR